MVDNGQQEGYVSQHAWCGIPVHIECIIPSMSNENLSSSETVNMLASSAYGLGTGIQSECVASNDNETYLIKTAGDQKYVGRIYRPNKPWILSQENIQFEIDLLLHLKDRGIPVSYPVSRVEGGFLSSIQNNELTFALFTFAEGQANKPHTEYQAKLYGKTIANFHNASNSFSGQNRFITDLDFLVEQPIGYLESEWAGSRPNDVNLLRQTSKLLKDHESLLIGSPLEDLDGFWGPIGGDFHGMNCHFNFDEITLFDFDMCSIGHRAYDVAVYLWDILISKENLDVWNSFIQEYSYYHQLSSEEQRLVPLLVLARHIWYMGTFMLYKESAPPNYYSSKYWDGLMSQLQLWQSEEFQRKIKLNLG